MLMFWYIQTEITLFIISFVDNLIKSFDLLSFLFTGNTTQLLNFFTRLERRQRSDKRVAYFLKKTSKNYLVKKSKCLNLVILM